MGTGLFPIQNGLKHGEALPSLLFNYDGWNFNSGSYLFETDTK